MNIDALKTSILNYISHFTMYDYVAYAWLTLTFFMAILLSIMLAKKSILSSILTLLFSLILLIVGPIVLKMILDDFLRPTKSILLQQQKLTYSNVLVINAALTNTSKKDYSICQMEASVIKQSDSPIKNFIYTLKPLRKKSISIEKPIKAGESEEFNIVFYNYNFDGDINTTIKSKCY